MVYGGSDYLSTIHRTAKLRIQDAIDHSDLAATKIAALNRYLDIIKNELSVPVAVKRYLNDAITITTRPETGARVRQALKSQV
jgi:hypothetical protein